MESLTDSAHPMLPMALPEAEEVKRDEQGLPVFTGDEVFRTRENDYRIVLAMAAEGNSIRSIARVVGMSKNTVQAILARERASMTMEKYREETGVRLRHSLAQVMDRLTEAMADEERMGKASLRDLAYAMKEMAEKLQLFTGGATHRAGHQQEQEHAGDLEHLRRMQAMEAEVVEVGPAKGVGGGQ